MNINLLQSLLIIAMANSVITCAFIQKTKGMFKKSSLIALYSFFVNVLIGIAFCITFTDISVVNSLWVGIFSYIGADTLYKTLEGKLKPYSEITKKEEIKVIERVDK